MTSSNRLHSPFDECENTFTHGEYNGCYRQITVTVLFLHLADQLQSTPFDVERSVSPHGGSD